MIVINPESNYEVTHTEYEAHESDPPESYFYVERATNFIYEVKLFPDFAMVRLAMPDHQPPIQRLDLILFSELFDEYGGDNVELRKLLFGGSASHIMVSPNNDGNK